jgi:hypothetical protein
MVTSGHIVKNVPPPTHTHTHTHTPTHTRARAHTHTHARTLCRTFSCPHSGDYEKDETPRSLVDHYLRLKRIR